MAGSAHQVATGHSSQRGRGRQIVAPKSMSAWFQAAGAFRSRRATARSSSRAPVKVSPVHRLRTRRRFVSTAGTSAPKAKQATAAADARQSFELSRILGPPVGGDDRRRLPEPGDSPRVSQTTPVDQRLGEGSGGEGFGGGEGLEEVGVAFDDPSDLGLLEHDLRHQDRPRVRPATPWQVPSVLPVPVQQRPVPFLNRHRWSW